MSRKVWLGVAMLATGITLLVVAGFAAGATSHATASHGKTGLAMTLDMSNSDFDYLDPALAYPIIVADAVPHGLQAAELPG